MKVDQCYPIFHWSWNFWEIFSLSLFLKNFSRMKRWWREELQLPVTVKRSFLSSYKWKNCSSDIGSFVSFRSKFFAKVISYFKSFSSNENDLRILQTELKYAKKLLLNHYRKSVPIAMKLQDMRMGRVKTNVTNHLRAIHKWRHTLAG